MATSDNPPFKTAEAEVQSHSASLRRELGIADLVLAQILIIIVPEFYGTAVKAGSAHVVLWLLAILLFFIPHALVVAHLNRLMPLEGGLYEWARLGFSDRVGFLTAWNIWLLQTVQVSQIALVTTTYISYAAPRAAWIATNRTALVAASVVLIALMMLIARLGLGIGKWFSNAGSVVTVFHSDRADPLAVFPRLARASTRVSPAPAGLAADDLVELQHLQQNDLRGVVGL